MILRRVGYLYAYSEDIQWLDVDKSIFISREIFKKSCLTSELNAVFNVKPSNFPFITFSLGFEQVSLKS